MSNPWQLQQARNQFSVAAANALKDGVQVITRHGQVAVVALAVSDYRKLKPKKDRLAELLQACPVKNCNLHHVRDTARDISM